MLISHRSRVPVARSSVVASTRRLLLSVGAGLAVAVATVTPIGAQQNLTSPREFFGHEIGADYVLPNYTKFMEYWQLLARQSDRMVLDTIGMTEEGRPQLMAIVTSPENHRNLDRYREISNRLARAEGLTDEQAQTLAREGKGIVWIDGGLHATEVLGAQQLIETNWQLVSGNDEETLRFLDELVILMVHANPDGMELVSDWYMRNPNPRERSTGGIPRLYQKYIGHDNNRDFYLASQKESENMNRVLYNEWNPQVMYNHHQTGPAGTVMFAPPFRDPANYNFHPLIRTQLDLVGAAMHNRFVTEDKPGVTMRSGAGYSTWWNGGLRTTVYFHNMIGLLTETIGNPTPISIPFLPNRQLASADLPYPIQPQQWHFRQSVDYSVTANRAVLDIVSRHREQFLYNIYKMGRDAIEAGSRDSWTIWPKRIEAVEAAARAERQNGNEQGAGDMAFLAGFSRQSYDADKMMSILRDPEKRDPRAYILPSNQKDFPTVVKFIHALQKNGIDIHQATSQFTVNGKTYPAGSFVVQTAQAFRPHILDMFEPQDHPNDFPYPGGPPSPPYDNAGWTLAYQMGVQFDRSLEAVEGPFRKLTEMAEVPPVTVAQAPANGGYLLDPSQNNAFIAVNRLLAAGREVHRTASATQAGGHSFPAGSFFVPAHAQSRTIVQQAGTELGVRVGVASSRPSGTSRVSLPRVGLVDRYGGSMPSGWTRWLFEKHDMPFKLVFPQELDAGNLNSKFDVLVFVDGLIPPVRSGGGGFGGGFGGRGPDPSSIPAEYRSWLGSITAERTIPQLKRFMEQGGTILTIGSSTSLAEHIGLPVENHLVERKPNGEVTPLTRAQYYIPGSLVEVAVDTTATIAAGMDSHAIMMFDNSPTFRLPPDARARGIRAVAWFDTDTPLRSGWAWGQGYLQHGVSVAEADVGQGKLVLYGPEVLFRAQPAGTFKLVFNALVR